MTECAFHWPPEAGGERPLLCLAWMGGAWQEQTHTHLRDRGLREAEQRPLLLVGPEPRLPAVPSLPWDGSQLCTWSVLMKAKVLRGKQERAPGASPGMGCLGPDPLVKTTSGG